MMQYASMFACIPGVRVTIVDERSTFLDFVDREIIDLLRQSLV
jgi:pyruvate/2-oxoglutarate dehydrogenase complex dihydrolipoamide dehydrogenase (E3) component